MHDDTGSVTGFLGFASDITERRQLEEQIRQQQKLEGIGLLAGGIAHDFNNMLTPIFVYSEMIRNKFNVDDPIHKRASAILDAAGKANDLVRQLLSFSRKQILATQLHDLNEIIATFSAILRRTIRESVVIHNHLSSSPCPIKADRIQIEQILLNLAINAQDAISENGFVTIETGHVVLDGRVLSAASGGTTRPVCHVGRGRLRQRHGRRHLVAYLRAVFQYQTRGQGDRTGAVHGVRHCQTA